MTRTITYTLPRFPSTTFTVELLDLFVLPDGTYPRRKQTCPTDAGGAGSVVLDVPSDGAVRYRWRLPDGSQRDSAIGAGADTTLELLLAASTPGVASDALLTMIEALLSSTQFRDAVQALFVSGQIVYDGELLSIVGGGGGGGGEPSGYAGYATGMDWPFTYAT